MNRENVKQILKSLIQEGEAVVATHHIPPSFDGYARITEDHRVDSGLCKKWNLSSLATLRSVFGEESDHYQHAKAATVRSWDYGDAQDLLSVLKSALNTFSLGLEASVPTGLSNSLEIIERVCRKFHAVVRQLRSRHSERSTLDVKDEYDVQDLLHSLLEVFFEDIRPEEGTPSVAGGAARMDFLLKEEEIVVETKMARKGLGAKDVGEQLIIDIAKYQSHPSCRTLVCFVYNPDGLIRNPTGIERDLSRVSENLVVKVFIYPK